METVETLRLEGNEYFKQKNYELALESYSKALKLDPNHSIILSNRSATNFQLKRYVEAENDARIAVQLDPDSIKAIYRHATALKSLGKNKDALKSIENGLLLDPENSALIKLKNECEIRKTKIKKGFLWSEGERAKETNLNCPDLNCECDIKDVIFLKDFSYCQSCEDVPRINPSQPIVSDALIQSEKLPISSSPYFPMMLDALKKLVRSIVRGEVRDLLRDSSESIDKTFRALCETSTLQESLYPGASTALLADLPSSLRELLFWKDLQVGLDLTAIATHATSVFEGVRTKGITRGEIMDEITVKVLVPPIAREAFGLKVVESVRTLLKKISIATTKYTLSLAEPFEVTGEEGDAEREERLSRSVILSMTGCFNPTKEKNNEDNEQNNDEGEEGEEEILGGREMGSGVGVGVQDDFLGPEWAQLILKDFARYIRNEKMSKWGNWAVKGDSLSGVEGAARGDGEGGYMSWVEIDSLEEGGYPALAEAARALQSLPFEINAKSHSALALCRPCPGRTLLAHFPAYSSQPMHFDSIEGEADSGIRLTCSYHLYPSERGDGERENLEEQLQVVLAPSLGPELRLSIPSDTLVLHRSSMVAHSREPLPFPSFSLIHFLHSKE